MSRTPAKVPSAIGGNGLQLFEATGNDGERCLLVEVIDTNNNYRFLGSATVASSVFAERLSQVRGFTAKYVAPIEVPKYLGAVVERITDRIVQRFVRWARDEESSIPWVGRDGSKYSNSDVTSIMVNGGYEREPEFPRRSP